MAAFLQKKQLLTMMNCSKIKDAIPYVRNIPHARVCVSYKDVNLSGGSETAEGVFSISPGDSIVLIEAFRNAFKRVHIKIREIDSLFVAKSLRESLASGSCMTSSTTDLDNECQTTSRKKLGFQSEPVLSGLDWKKDKEENMSTQLQGLQDKLVAIEIELEEMNRPIVEPPQLGQYKTIIYGNCHICGHRAEGNKNNAACVKTICVSYACCGQQKKPPEHFDEVRRLTRHRKQLKSEVDILDKNKKNLAAFQSKSISAFTTAVTSHLIKAFPDRYDPRTATGKIKLQKDIASIRIACNNKIPNVSSNERYYYSYFLNY